MSSNPHRPNASDSRLLALPTSQEAFLQRGDSAAITVAKHSHRTRSDLQCVPFTKTWNYSIGFAGLRRTAKSRRRSPVLAPRVALGKSYCTLIAPRSCTTLGQILALTRQHPGSIVGFISQSGCDFVSRRLLFEIWVQRCTQIVGAPEKRHSNRGQHEQGFLEQED